MENNETQPAFDELNKAMESMGHTAEEMQQSVSTAAELINKESLIRDFAEECLAEVLRTLIDTNDAMTGDGWHYQEILEALSYAEQCEFNAGIRFNPQFPEYPIAYIELPTGQVSWRLPAHEEPWDGHTPEQKQNRIRAYIDHWGLIAPSCSDTEVPHEVRD